MLKNSFVNDVYVYRHGSRHVDRSLFLYLPVNVSVHLCISMFFCVYKFLPRKHILLILTLLLRQILFVTWPVPHGFQNSISFPLIATIFATIPSRHWNQAHVADNEFTRLLGSRFTNLHSTLKIVMLIGIHMLTITFYFLFKWHMALKVF